MLTGEIMNVEIKRAKVLEHFVNKPQSMSVMEACGGAHHRARELTALGHTLRLLHAKIVRPFVSGNKIYEFGATFAQGLKPSLKMSSKRSKTSQGSCRKRYTP
jgi:hypothetical protein